MPRSRTTAAKLRASRAASLALVLSRVALVLLAALVVAAPAAARRAPTAAERAAIAAEVRGYENIPHSPAARDNRVVSIAVSSVDPRYAAVRLRSPSAGPSVMVLHRSGPGWWVVEFGSSLGCVTAPASVLRDLAVGCSPPRTTAWINSCGPLLAAPTQLMLACADGNYYLAGLRWRHWGGAAASASGTAHANDCKPDCAAGHFHSYPVTVTADRPRRCNSARYYARLTIVYANKRPAGIAKRDVQTLGC